MIDIDEFLRDLADPDAEVSASQLARVSSMSEEEAAGLSERWAEIDLRRRRSLLEQLTELAEDNVELNFDRVFEIGLSDSDPDVRRYAIGGLWENEHPATFERLLRMLAEDSNAGVRAEAALALGRFALQAELGALGQTDVERLENALHAVIEDDAEEVEVRGRALESIGARSERWVTDVIDQAFDSGERRLRISAVHAMGRNCDPAWLPLLLSELENEDAEMRYEATVAMGSIGEESVIPYLVSMLEDEDVEVRAAATSALGEIGGDTAKGALEDVAVAGEAALRELALEALAQAEFTEDPFSFSVRGDQADADGQEA